MSKLLRRALANNCFIRYEIVCPDCSADVKYVNDISELSNEELECDVCGCPFIPTNNDLWINLMEKEEK